MTRSFRSSQPNCQSSFANRAPASTAPARTSWAKRSPSCRSFWPFRYSSRRSPIRWLGCAKDFTISQSRAALCHSSPTSRPRSVISFRAPALQSRWHWASVRQSSFHFWFLAAFSSTRDRCRTTLYGYRTSHGSVMEMRRCWSISGPAWQTLYARDPTPRVHRAVKSSWRHSTLVRWVDSVDLQLGRWCNHWRLQQNLSFQDNFLWDILALIVLIVVFRLAAYGCLVLRARSKE